MKRIFLFSVLLILSLGAAAQKTNITYTDVLFKDPLEGWIIGEDLILHTLDGGTNWDTVFYNASYYFSDICFVTEDKGFIVGLSNKNNNSTAVLLKTTDAGASWENVMPVQVEALGLSEIFFIDESIGWAVGNVILKTTDGGENWVQQAKELEFGLTDVFFVNQETGWAVGNEIMHTQDGGQVWSFQNINTDNPLYTLHFTDEYNGFILGGFHPDDMYSHFTTVNGGIGWESHLIEVINPSFFDCDFVDNLTGWAVGDRKNIIKTIDGGINWVYQDNPVPLSYQLRGVDFINENEGWAVGTSNTLIHTTNGGETWEEVTSRTEPSQLASIGFAISPNPNSGLFTLKCRKQPTSTISVDIYDLYGHLIASYYNVSIETKIDISDQPDGIYFISLTINNQILPTQKIIKL